MQSPSDDGNRGGLRPKADAAENAALGCELNDSELYGRDALGPDTYYLFESDADAADDYDALRLVDSWTEIRGTRVGGSQYEHRLSGDTGRDKKPDATAEGD